MGHVTSSNPWGNIDIDTTTGVVFFQQKWRYDWRLWTGVSDARTLDEKQRFHRKVDLSIWRVWSNRYKVIPRGSHELVRRFGIGGIWVI